MLKRPKSLEEKLRSQMDPNIELPRVSQERGNIPEKPQIKKQSLKDKIKADWENSNVLKDIGDGLDDLGRKLEAEERQGYNQGGIVKDDRIERISESLGLNPAAKAAFYNSFAKENNYGKSNATSVQGARGPMQIMPKTFEGLKRNGQLSPEANIDNESDNYLAAGKIFQEAQNGKLKGKNDPSLFAAYYHGGPSAIDNYGQINPNRKDALGTRTVDYASDANRYMNPRLPDGKNPVYASKNQFAQPFYERSNESDPNDPLRFNPNAPATFSEVGYPNDDYYMQQATQGGPTFESALSAIGLGQKNQQPYQYVSSQGVGFNQGQENASVPDYQLAAAKNEEAILKAQQYGTGGQNQQQQQQSSYGKSPAEMLAEIERLKSNALTTQSKVDEDIRLAQENLADTQIKQQKKFLEDRQIMLQDSNKQIDKFVDDYSKSNIDPFRSIRDASTSRMFSGAIGLILSGIGSALTGQPSQALMVIDRAIDRDIEAQKINIGKGKTILDIQLQKYGNEKDAVTATEVILGTQALAEMNKAIAMAKKPEIKSNLEINMANLKSAILEKQMELRKYGLEARAIGYGEPIIYGTPDYVNTIRNNKDLKELEYVEREPGKPWKVYFGGSKEEVRNFKNMDIALQNIKHALDPLLDENSARRLKVTDAAQLAQQLRTLAKLQFTTFEAAGVGSTRIAELEAEFADQVIPDLTSWNPKNWFATKKKLENFIDAVQTARDNRAMAYFPNYVPKPKPKDYGFQETR